MVILTMTHRTPVDHLGRARWRPRDEGGHRHLFASLAHILMRIPELRYFHLTFPAVLLILVAFMLAMGRHRGYRPDRAVPLQGPAQGLNQASILEDHGKVFRTAKGGWASTDAMPITS
ncbi:7TM domain-containing protein [Pseudomonas aeruginosa]